MINRPPTRIELKLDDDYCDYEESVNYRKNMNTNTGTNMQILNISSSSGSNVKQDYNLDSAGSSNFNLNPQAQGSGNYFYYNSNNNNVESPSGNRGNKYSGNYTKQNNIISEFISEEGGEVEEFQEEDDYVKASIKYRTDGKSNLSNNSDVNMR